MLKEAEKQAPGQLGAWDAAKLAAWRSAIYRAPEAHRRAELGCWILRSIEGGVAWSARHRMPLNSPHGPIQWRDGRIIFPGIVRWTEQQKMGVCRSKDDGITWEGNVKLMTTEQFWPNPTV